MGAYLPPFFLARDREVACQFVFLPLGWRTGSDLIFLSSLTAEGWRFTMAKRKRSSTRGFSRSAKRVAPPNHWTPMRGGIRF